MKLFKWITKEKISLDSINENTYQWLTRVNNLTETLKQTGAFFSLQVITQAFEMPYLEEIKVFQPLLSASSYFVRKVFLKGNDKPIIFARVVIPDHTYHNYSTLFEKLGSISIGNAILYADKEILRKEFEYRLLQTNENLFHEIKRSLKFSVSKRKEILEQGKPMDNSWPTEESALGRDANLFEEKAERRKKQLDSEETSLQEFDGPPFFKERLLLNQFPHWIRRSVFILPKGPLLLTEVFLEPLPPCPF